MSAAEPRVTAHYELTGDAFQRLWNWVLARQGLADGNRLSSVVAIARASLGLHAARLPSPFATVAARSTNAAVPVSLFSDETRQELVTVRCMRKTLHALPPDLAASAHAATVHFRERDALRSITNAGYSRRVVERVIDRLIALLADGRRLGHRQLEAALVADGVDRAVARLALKLAWERGQVRYVNETGSWNREVRTFQVADIADHALTREAATTALVAAYFDRYGPASLTDATWWSGLSRSAVLRALADAGDDLVQVTPAWSVAPQFMYQQSYERFRHGADRCGATGINLLAHEDVALKAYFQTRRRYLGALPARRAFNQIGEALPTILYDGQVVGTWSWDVRRRRVVCGFARGLTTPTVRDEARSRARRFSAVLRQGLDAGGG